MNIINKNERGSSVVVNLGNITHLDIPVDRVLDGAKEKLGGVVLMGFDTEGEFYFASTYADGGTVLWLMEMCKKRLMEVDGA